MTRKTTALLGWVVLAAAGCGRETPTSLDDSLLPDAPTTVEIVLGGQFLAGPTQVLLDGKGVQAEIVRYYKPPTRNQLNRELHGPMGRLSDRWCQLPGSGVDRSELYGDNRSL